MTTNTSSSPRKRMYIDRLFQWWFRTQAVIWSWNLSVAITSWYIFTLLYFEHHLHYILRILYTIMYMHIQYSIFNILYSIFYILYSIFYILYFMFYTLHSMSMCVSIYILFWILLSSQNIFLHRQWSTFWPTSFQRQNTSVVIFTGSNVWEGGCWT